MMKNLSLFTLIGLLATSSATVLNAAETVNCAKLPTCEELGYTDTVAHCPKVYERNSYGTLIETTIRKSIVCPFDATKGKCLHDAAVGQIGYFTQAPGAKSGWLLCDGSTYSKTVYPELAAFLGTQFCVTNHGGSCSSTVFAVPNYRGYFLRVYGTPSSSFGKVGNTSFTSPQKEGLPNISGGFPAFRKGSDLGTGLNAFTTTGDWSAGLSKGASDNWMSWYDFKASRYDSIYGSSSGVTPPNLAVYAYIYAGKIVQ